MKTKFSIIIPLYNKEKFIKSTIQSIMRQKYKNFEVIIIDDCCTDSSCSIVLDLQKLYCDREILVYKNETNMGVSYSRNRGIEVASGDYLMFLDADDEISEIDFLNNIDQYAQKYEFEYLMTNRNYYGKFYKPNFKANEKSLKYIEYNFFEIKDNISVALKGKFPFGGSASAVISKKQLINNRFNVYESHYEDWLFFIEIFLSSKSYYYSNVSIKINYDGNSLSRFNTKKVSLETPEIYTFLDKDPRLEKLRKRFFWMWMVGVVRNTRNAAGINQLLKIHKQNIRKNWIINKYSIYSVFKIIIYSTLRRNERT